MPTTLDDFIRARPDLAKARHGISKQAEARIAADEITSADIPIVILSDAKTGYRVDALGAADKFFVPLIESGEFRARATLGDAYARLDSFNRNGRLHYHDDQLWIDDRHAEEVFKEWSEKQTNWRFNSDGLVGAGAYLQGRTIAKVTARLKELDGDKNKLAEEADAYGLTLTFDERGNMGGSLFDMRKVGKVPEGATLRGAPEDKPNPQSNPIVNLRDPTTGAVRPEMQKKFADMQRAKGGSRLIQSWIKEAQSLGYSLDGRKIK
jgi:hypothetical protein